jgi:hypothetical protein
MTNWAAIKAPGTDSFRLLLGGSHDKGRGLGE